MMITNKKYEKYGNILANDILKKLVGSHDDFNRMEWFDQPSKNILIGVLNGVKGISDNVMEDKRLVNSLSVKFLLKNIKSGIDVDYKFFVYYRVYPTFEEQKKYAEKITGDKINFARIWQRKHVKGNFSFDESDQKYSLSSKISEVVDEIKNDSNALKQDPLFSKSHLDSEKSYNDYLKHQENVGFKDDYSWDCGFDIDFSRFIQNDEEYNLIEIALINNTDIDNEISLFDTSIFNPILNISLNENEIIPFVYNSNDVVYEGDLRCLNCQGDYIENDNQILTKNYATFNQEKIVPADSLDNIDITFEMLSTVDGISQLDLIYSYMEEFYKNSVGIEVQKKEFYEMMERFKCNVDLLKKDPNVCRAFNLMNKTFKRNSKYPGWRLFQIVFIVSQLYDICEENGRDFCELLHVMTGGGKSESYFGIVIFTAFYDRLMGKKFGISAVTKFPLRMLSIQQLQRIANIFIIAEEIRKEEKIPGDEFSIAYFVGGQDSDFPNDNREHLLEIRDAKSNDEIIPGKIINKCPLCGGEVHLDIDEGRKVIIHKCGDCDKQFRLYYTDDEIYRMLPTFIVSTVDKWAGIASNRRYRNLLGGDLDSCPAGHGFIPSNDKCGFNVTASSTCDLRGQHEDIPFDTSPTLVIQDELHLVKEGFGTIDSHFESLTETMKSEFSDGSKFKNIVMTATVAGAENQIKNLYYKKTRIFPPSLEDSDGNGFFFYKSKENDKNIIQRKLIGLKPSILSYKLLFQILRYASQFIKDLEQNFEDFAEKYNFDKEELIEIHDYYKKLLTYHNKKEAAHSVSYSIDDYVNNHDDNYEVITEPLTGENNLDEIKDVMHKIEHYYDDGNNKERLYAVNATSIVSHGVDIDEWNFMIFDGMPRSTSEYIQALSRVGRKYFGLVFVLFSSTKTRDLSFYQNFNEFHALLDEKVENVPLTRWAKLGFKQTFTSIFSAALLNYLPNITGQVTYKPEMAKGVLSDDENRELLIDFIKKAYKSNSEMLGAEFFDEQIPKEFKERADYLIQAVAPEYTFTNTLKNNGDKYYRTQYGMRGIQEEISLTSANSDNSFRLSLRRSGR